MLYNYGAAILRAVGDTKRPLFFLDDCGRNKCIAEYVFSHRSASWSCRSRDCDRNRTDDFLCVSASVSLQVRQQLSIRFSRMGLKWIYLKQIFQVGIPAGIQSTVINFSNVLLQSSVNSFGSVAMAGYTAANNIFGFLFASVNSITQACMSFTSQNYSVGKWKRNG